ncbi:MAG: hypothetical protein V3U91_04845 [Candidatus Aminicenantaceae bacterium]
MKKIIFLFLLLFLVSMASAQNWFKGSFDDALTKAKAENKPVLIDFFEDG